MIAAIIFLVFMYLWNSINIKHFKPIMFVFANKLIIGYKPIDIVEIPY